MSQKIPESLKADLPQNGWGKILAATPVVMTVIATLLAGLASSEMTRAQYDRAMAAQLQSKAGDQWNCFQAEKAAGRHAAIDARPAHRHAVDSSGADGGTRRSPPMIRRAPRSSRAPFPRCLRMA
jgi:hypothetical protein